MNKFQYFMENKTEDKQIIFQYGNINYFNFTTVSILLFFLIS